MAIVYPRINSYEFLKMEGEPTPSTQTMESISRKGIDGNSFRILAKKNTPWQATTIIDVLDRNAATSLINTLAALTGKIVSVTTASNGTYNNVACISMSVGDLIPIGINAGGFNASSKFLIPMTWQFQRLDLI